MSDKPKLPSGTYAVEADRTITVDGVPFVSLTRCLKPKERGGSGYFSPVECDDFTHLAAAAPDLLAALESAPPPNPSNRLTAPEANYKAWHEGVRAAALAKVKA